MARYLVYQFGEEFVVWLYKGQGAAALVNWFAWREGQELHARTVLEPSRRGDVPTSIVPDYVIPQSGVKYEMDQYTEAWQREVALKLEEQLQKALGG